MTRKLITFKEWSMTLNNQGIWDPEVYCRIQKDSPVIHILSRINLLPYIDTYFFTFDSNIVLLPKHRSS